MSTIIYNANTRGGIFPSEDKALGEIYFEPNEKIKPRGSAINMVGKFWIIAEERLSEYYSIIEISTTPNGYPPKDSTKIAIPGSICCPFCDTYFDSYKIDDNSIIVECPSCSREIAINNYY